MILGLPTIGWVFLPLIGFILGVLVYERLDRYPVLRTWLIGMIFFGSRYFLESGSEFGRPDRVLSAMALWTFFTAFVAVGRWIIHRRYILR